MSNTRAIEDAVAGLDAGPSGYVRAACPICETIVGTPDRHAALSCHLERGYYKCWRCGTKGWLRGTRGHHYRNEWSEGVEDELGQIELPEGFIALSDKRCSGSILAQKAKDYLLGRHIDETKQFESGVGVVVSGVYCNRVCVPVTACDGSLVGWFGRSLSDDSPLPHMYPAGMQRGQYLFNEAALQRDDAGSLLAVEGILDALPYWPDASAFMGKPSEEHIRKLCATKRPVVLALDGDAWREGMAWAVRLRVEGKENADWMKLPPCEDPNSWRIQF